MRRHRLHHPASWAKRLLSHEESISFATTAMKQIAGRVPTIVGASAAGLDNLAAFSKR